MSDMTENVLDPVQLLVNASALTRLSITNSRLKSIAVYNVSDETTPSYGSVRQVLLQNNRHRDYTSLLTSIAQWFPNADTVDISDNELDDDWPHTSYEHQLLNQTTQHIRHLTVTRCKLVTLPPIPANVHTLNIGDNALTVIDQLPTRLQHLNASYNQLQSVPTTLPTTLLTLNLAANLLRYFDMTANSQHAQSLSNVNLSFNTQLEHVIGQLADLRNIQSISLDNCSIRSFAENFFGRYSSRSQRITVSLLHNPFQCGCLLGWMYNSDQRTHIDVSLSNTTCADNDTLLLLTEASRTSPPPECAVGGIQQASVTVKRFTMTYDARVPCHAYPYQAVPIEWHRVEPYLYIGRWTPNTKENSLRDINDTDLSPFTVDVGGTLVIHAIDRTLVERYVCTAANKSVMVKVRIDYEHWIRTEIYSIVCAVVTCAVFFTLHMIWTAIRKIVIWRLNRAERTSRIRMTLAGIEKYRAAQIEKLHKSYVARTHTIRDNYHNQVRA
jgi:hypothetical protein